MADILTGGRVTFGVGRGYHTREVETFGSPLLDQPANRELFEEQVEIIFKAFNEESFSHQGKHYTLPPEVPYRGYTLKELTLVPRPLRRPVECWQPIQGGTQRAMDFMARMVSKGWWAAVPPKGGPCTRWSWRGRKRTPALVSPWNWANVSVSVSTSTSPMTARKACVAARYYEENLKMFGPLRLVRALTDEQIEIMADPAGALCQTP